MQPKSRRILWVIFGIALAMVLSSLVAAVGTMRRRRDLPCHAPTILPNFLTPEECAAVIEAALAQGLARSGVGRITQTSENRTSYQTFLEHHIPAVDAVISKAERYLGVSRDMFEDLQVVRYNESEKYDPHYDSDASWPLAEKRSDTILMYLCDVPEGGETGFPKLGIQVTPEAGKAVHWKNVDVDGTVLPCAFHGGNPVRKGTKWICTVWCRLH